MALVDMERLGLPVIIDLTLPQADRIKELGIKQGNVIVATVFSTITTMGQSEEWHLVNIQDIYRGVIGLNELEHFVQILKR